ncbi:energy-coupling factor transporter transmembrane component T family protein [Rhizobium sp. C1]|uniref:energy-coupling factor transporter transmembrane component T family protein n=1 Tax=Rhizobium sp. C1 TaxID=1349799 RepID=UPI001E3381A6|nr:energy-coupling factor transporter transmembrane protein EcfT [Rhizobium sp. C1]MCD2179682.1 energy-coupling factor transporter transmembrane protein EcfT [Rhizobium sp. C1]
MLTSLYVEGDTFLHRQRPGAKLALILVFGLALYFTELLAVQAAAVAVTGAIYFALPMPFREAVQRLKPVLFTIAVLAIFNGFVLSWQEALVSTLRLLAVVFLAAAVTATTRIADFMETITWALRPAERLGIVRAADVGLALGLVLRFLPDIFGHYEALKQAHAARGIAFRPLRAIGPLIILTLKDADAIADAIDARGIRGR